MKIVVIEDMPYAVFELEDGRGWDIWKLVLQSNVYHVGKHGCTCPAAKPCKHMKALEDLIHG